MCLVREWSCAHVRPHSISCTLCMPALAHTQSIDTVRLMSSCVSVVASSTTPSIIKVNPPQTIRASCLIHSAFRSAQAKKHRPLLDALAVCLYEENRVVNYNCETRAQKALAVPRPDQCCASPYLIAVTTTSLEDCLYLFTHTGNCVQHSFDSLSAQHAIDLLGAKCVAFHTSNPNVLAVGFGDGSVHAWDVQSNQRVLYYKNHTHYVSSLHFAADGRLFVSSCDNKGSIVTFDQQFQLSRIVRLDGHADWVNNLKPLSLDTCVTCSNDATVKVWNSRTGACITTLREHTESVDCLAVHPTGHTFASGSMDQSFVIWSSDTFQLLHQIHVENCVQSLFFDKANLLCVGVFDHGIVLCNATTGEVGDVAIRATGYIAGVAHGASHNHTRFSCLQFLISISQYLRVSPGFHPRMQCGPHRYGFVYVWLLDCCRSYGKSTRICTYHTSLWRLC